MPPRLQPRGPILSRLAALLVIAFGFLPIVNWIPGGRVAPWYGPLLRDWVLGSIIAIGGGVVLAILTKGWSPELARVEAWAHERVAAPGRTGVAFFVLSLALYALIARTVFSGVPLHLDELAQVVQARIFAEGRLFLEAGPYPEFRSALHIVDDNGRWFSQFPPGAPLLLVPGVWLGATWMMGPVLGALSVALCWGVMRRLEARALVALVATTVFALAPFMAFMSGSHMNHVGALLWALLATYALCRTGDGVPFVALAGFALGMLATIRPVDAAAFGVPAGVWFLWRALRVRGRWRDVVISGLALSVPVAALLWYNWRTTGDPWLFAYEALWGPGHGLGFHAAPWGDAHTPSRGFELVSLYFLRLQTYLFETSIPSLGLVVLGIWWSDKMGLVERYWLVSGALLVAIYWGYWHDGFYLGPRFLFLLTPALALFATRGPLFLAARLPAGSIARRGLWWTLAVSVGMGLASNLPGRVSQYSRGLAIMRRDPTGAARDAGVHDALILVRESWGAQLVPRLWALGVPRAMTEATYRSVDACALDSAITSFEGAGLRGAQVVTRLLPLLADSARLQSSPWSPDASERVMPGRPYSATCARRISEDRGGFTIFLPVLTRPWGDNVYARELHARDSLLLRAYPARPLYLLRSASSAPDAPLVLVPLALDSLRREWETR